MSEVIKKAATNEVVEFLYGDLRERSAPVIFNSATGNPVVFNDGANGLPIKSLKVNFSPIQNGSGDPSPENVRPILPWNGLTVFGGGKNLFDASAVIRRERYLLNDNGVEQASSSSGYTLNRTKVKAGSIYTISGTIVKGAEACRLYFYNGDTFISRTSTINVSSIPYTFTVPQNCDGIAIQYNMGTVDFSTIQLKAGNTASAYEEYKPITETDIIFPSPVYGATLDIVSGVMTVRPKKIMLSDAEWSYNESGYFYAIIADKVETIASADGVKYPVYCSALAYGGVKTASEFTDGGIYQTYSSKNLYIKDSTCANVAELLQKYGSQEIVYYLVTPVEIQLTPEQLQSLLGTNTIWSDANGDIEVEYRADTELFLKQNTVKDVQIDGSSILNDGIANVPLMAWDKLGVAKVSNNYGLTMGSTGGQFLQIDGASQSTVKAGGNSFAPITPSHQHESTFYGLAKVAGADMASLTGEIVGVYPQAQKTAIQTMLGIEADIPLVETLTGSTVSITGMPNVRYICETAISELTITPPASGSIVVRFTAGSNCIVSLPQTVKFPAWFDISSLENGTTYEIIITDGVYGGVMSWA